MNTVDLPRLEVKHCLKRQGRLIEILHRKSLEAALIVNRQHVHYFSGYWGTSGLPCALLITLDGTTRLSCPGVPVDEIAVQHIFPYQPTLLATLIDDLSSVAMEPLLRSLPSRLRGGYDELPFLLPNQVHWESIRGDLLDLRRTKFPDEVNLIKHAIKATEAALVAVRPLLVPGVKELTVFSEIHRAATDCAGEVIGELGNNFQSGASGALPRQRGLVAGELFALDVSVQYRGYRSDLCRTFTVGDGPTSEQVKAQEHVEAVLGWVESIARPKVSCHWLYEQARQRLDGFCGWKFPHHLGHGIGLSAHESPRLNPYWNDHLRPGDVIAVEPGLYGPELKEGIRLEQNYLVTDKGLKCLSSLPLQL